MDKLNQCRMDLVKGVYDLYLITRDKEDLV